MIKLKQIFDELDIDNLTKTKDSVCGYCVANNQKFSDVYSAVLGIALQQSYTDSEFNKCKRLCLEYLKYNEEPLLHQVLGMCYLHEFNIEKALAHHRISNSKFDDVLIVRSYCYVLAKNDRFDEIPNIIENYIPINKMNKYEKDILTMHKLIQLVKEVKL